MKKKFIMGMMGFYFLMGLCCPGFGAEGKQKFLVILQAGTETHEGMARAVHALLYTQELREHHHEVVLLFDGAGTEWAKNWNQAESEDKNVVRYQTLKKAGLTEIVCDYCAGAFKVKKDLVSKNLTLVGEFEGHPSIAKWIALGYQVLIL